MTGPLVAHVVENPWYHSADARLLGRLQRDANKLHESIERQRVLERRYLAQRPPYSRPHRYIPAVCRSGAATTCADCFGFVDDPRHTDR